MTEYRPFSTGTQWADWDSRNCGSCKQGYDMKHGKFKCEYQFMLTKAYIIDGQITEDVAKAIGYLDNKDCYTWECLAWERR